METDKLLDLISDHLQEVNDNQGERVKRIESMLDFLNFNLRLTNLSKEEKEDFVNSVEGYPLTEEMRKTLDNCPSEERKNYYISMWARSTYFRKCAWLDYLCGKTDKKLSIKPVH